MLARRNDPVPEGRRAWAGEVHWLPLGAGDDGDCVVVWGRCWTDEGRERAHADARAGLLPWICQRCAGKVCPRCGAPERHPLGTDVVDAEGRTGHLPLMPIGRGGCRNASCVATRD